VTSLFSPPEAGRSYLLLVPVFCIVSTPPGGLGSPTSCSFDNEFPPPLGDAGTDSPPNILISYGFLPTYEICVEWLLPFSSIRFSGTEIFSRCSDDLLLLFCFFSRFFSATPRPSNRSVRPSVLSMAYVQCLKIATPFREALKQFALSFVKRPYTFAMHFFAWTRTHMTFLRSDHIRPSPDADCPYR